MHSMHASVHPTPSHTSSWRWTVIWFRTDPKTYDSYRVMVKFSDQIAADKYRYWHNKWIDENVAT